MNRHRRGSAIIGFTGVALALGAAAGLAVADETQQPSPVTLASSVTTPSPGGPFLSPPEVVNAITDRLGRKVFVGHRIGLPPNGYRPVEDPSVPIPEAFRNGVWAYFTVQAPSETVPDRLRVAWLAYLAAGAIRDEFHAASLPPLYSFSADVITPDGRRSEDVVGSLGDVALGQRFSAVTARELDLNVRNAANSLGIRVKSVEAIRASQLSPLVIVETEKPQLDVYRLEELARTLVGDPGTYEGFFLQLEDVHGRPVAIRALAARAGVGQGWIRPDLDGHRGIPVPGHG